MEDKNPEAVALGKKRWAGKSAKERGAFSRKGVLARKRNKDALSKGKK